MADEITPKDQRPYIAEAIKNNKICNDFYEGVTAVKNETYLPKYRNEDDSTYKIRVDGTLFSNMFAPIIDATAGMVMSKQPTVTGFETVEFDNLDLQGKTLAGFTKDAIKRSLKWGVHFVAVQTNEERPYLKHFEYDQLKMIIEDQGRVIGIVFKEEDEERVGEFGFKKVQRYTYFKEYGGEVWWEGNDKFAKRDEWTNTLSDPAVVLIETGEKKSLGVYISKMKDIAEANHVHLITKSHISNVLAKIGDPILQFFGMPEDDQKTINTQMAAVFQDKTKEGLEYAEAEGRGLQHVKDEAKNAEDMIDKLTFGLFDKAQHSTVVDAKESKEKTSSLLTDIAVEIEGKFNKLFKYYVELGKGTVTEKDHIEFNKDFTEEHINIETAFDLLKEREMSRETFYTVLQTGRLPKDFTPESESEKIEQNGGLGID